MNTAQSVSKVLPWVVLALVAALGCGGKSASKGAERENEAGTDSGGSAGSGGSVSSGGRAGEGGSSMAGTSGTGTAQAGSGGTSPVDPCSLPAPKLRTCDGSPFFFHDVTTGECVSAPASRCPDNFENTFPTLAACLGRCPSARPAPNACDQSSQCVVAQPGCCGACEPIETEQLVAINQLRRDSLGGDCDVACGTCRDVTELERTSQYFVPACLQGTCQVLDLRATSATECGSDDDCKLRDGSGCCEGCDGTGLIALSDPALVINACAPGFGCDACAPPIPEAYEAGCNENGRCVVRQNSNNSDGRLIRGDVETCPVRADAVSSCLQPPASDCTYAGGSFGASSIAAPVTCFCDVEAAPEVRWLCVATDAEGNTDCPRKYPPAEPCALDQMCTYGLGIAVASCSCSADESAPGSFQCGL